MLSFSVLRSQKKRGANAHKKLCASEKKLMTSFLIGCVCSVRKFKSLTPTRPPGIFNFKRCPVLSFIHIWDAVYIRGNRGGRNSHY